MQTQNVEQIGYVYKRVKRGRGRKRFDFERRPAIKISGTNGAVLLRPVPVSPPVSRQAFITIMLAEGVTVQLATKTNDQQRTFDEDRSDSRQCSQLCVECRHVRACICLT